MNVHNHPTLEAHRLACVDLVHLMNSDWYDESRLRGLLTAINPWKAERLDAQLQTLYRPRYTLHFHELTGTTRVQDCPEDYLRGVRAIAMAQMLPIDVFDHNEPRRFNLELTGGRRSSRSDPDSSQTAHHHDTENAQQGGDQPK